MDHLLYAWITEPLIVKMDGFAMIELVYLCSLSGAQRRVNILGPKDYEKEV